MGRLKEILRAWDDNIDTTIEGIFHICQDDEPNTTKKLESIRNIFNWNENKDESGSTVLHLLSGGGKANMMKLILQFGASVNSLNKVTIDR